MGDQSREKKCIESREWQSRESQRGREPEGQSKEQSEADKSRPGG